MVYCPYNLVSESIYHRLTSFPSKYTIESMVYCSHLQIWSTPVGYEELARGFEPIRNGEIFLMINKKNYVDLRMCCSVTLSYICVILHTMLRLAYVVMAVGRVHYRSSKLRRLMPIWPLWIKLRRSKGEKQTKLI